jgi:uncharacterized protein (TIGR02145 family)
MVYKVSQAVYYVVEYETQPITTMQQMTATYCNNMEPYSTMKLTDTRNNQDYRVRKMPDGKCWMIDNLKLSLSTSRTLTTANSNVSSTITIPATAAKTSGDLGYDAWAWADPSNTSSCASDMMIDPASTSKCGYFYNWYTATASSGKQATASGYVMSSICPKGWHLPRGADGTVAQNEFAVLNSAMYNGSTTGSTATATAYAQNWWHTGIFAGPRSGSYDSGFNYQGYYGVFWSSSTYSSNYYARVLDLNPSGVLPGTSHAGKNTGFAVRCLSS